MVWDRCAQLSALHAYLAKNVSSILLLDELLRAEWVARLSALDLYIHELVAQLMLAIFERRRPPTAAYLKFRLSNETLDRIRAAATLSDASAAFDLEVRNQLSFYTYQDPDKISAAVKLCSEIELWSEIALKLGATSSTKADEAKKLKKMLSLIVRRRNQIAHEGDVQPSPLREPWPISQADVVFVAAQIERVVKAIDAVVQSP
jgi:RiboL-PSP-HEPN